MISSYPSILSATLHKIKLMAVAKGLTDVITYAILSSVIALQKPARPATGGIPAGIPFFAKGVFLCPSLF